MCVCVLAPSLHACMVSFWESFLFVVIVSFVFGIGIFMAEKCLGPLALPICRHGFGAAGKTCVVLCVTVLLWVPVAVIRADTKKTGLRDAV